MEKKSAKYLAAKKRLKRGFESTFDELLNDYQFFSIQRVGRAFINYEIIADLVNTGWRKTESER